MKLVIDTNILISAAWRDRLPEAVIVWIAAQEDWDWIVLRTEMIARWEDLIDELTVVIGPEIEVKFSRDVKDAKFLACSIAASADYFITGDSDFADARKLGDTVILSAAMFKRTSLILYRYDRRPVPQ